MRIQNVFQQSPVNGGRYIEPEPCTWRWPQGTWLQQRRVELQLTKREEVIKLLKHMKDKSNEVQ